MESITKKRIAYVFILLAVILSLANIVRILALKETSIRANVAVVIPYHVRLRETRLNKNGTSDLGCDLSYAVRSDGAYSSLAEQLNAKMPVSSRELVFPSGLKVEINDVLELKSSIFDKSKASFYNIRDPRSDCIDSLMHRPFLDGQRVIGNDTILGYHTVKIRYRQFTWWFAPDLGCAMLRGRRKIS